MGLGPRASCNSRERTDAKLFQESGCVIRCSRFDIV